MTTQLSGNLFQTLIQAWQKGNRFIQVMICVSVLCLLGAGIVFVLAANATLKNELAGTVGKTLIMIGVMLILILTAYQGTVEESKREKKIEEVEKHVKKNPKETQAAWELARIKLEAYMNRNLNQVRAIFWLTVVVMALGFALIGYGVGKLYQSPENFNPSVVVAVAGVLVNFIGSSFLLIYRSVMSQASNYVNVLERINAVGMSLQILDSLKESNPELQQKTTADVVRQMLQMYSPQESRTNKKE